MNKQIRKDFGGILKFEQQGILHNAHFRVHDDLVLLLPDSIECRKAIYDSSMSAKAGNEEDKWLFGLTESGYSVAFYKPAGLQVHISAPVDLGKASFKTPVILQSTSPDIVDLSTFDVIEFRGGIMDLLQFPGKAVDEKYFREKRIEFRDKETFTTTFPVYVNGESFDVTYTVSLSDYSTETGMVPDLRKNIHSALQFHFSQEQPIRKFKTYYGYALQLFQFCTRRLNVGFEVRLYKKVKDRPHTIVTRVKDGYDDYANDVLYFSQIIRFDFLGDKFPQLFKLLNEEGTQPSLLFLPKRNNEANSILYTNITDICVALETESDFAKANLLKTIREEAKALAVELTKLIDASQYDVSVKDKAKGIINGNLPEMKLSLREKIFSLYDEFAEPMKFITEPAFRTEHGITKSYTDKDFKKLIRKFIKIRNLAAHAGFSWNEGYEIYGHLQLIVYFSILKRSGYTIEESQKILYQLFVHLF